MSSILHDDILIGAQKVPLFKIRIIDGLDEPLYLESTVDLPMYTLAVEQVKAFSYGNKGFSELGHIFAVNLCH